METNKSTKCILGQTKATWLSLKRTSKGKNIAASLLVPKMSPGVFLHSHGTRVGLLSWGPFTAIVFCVHVVEQENVIFYEITIVAISSEPHQNGSAGSCVPASSALHCLQQSSSWHSKPPHKGGQGNSSTGKDTDPMRQCWPSVASRKMAPVQSVIKGFMSPQRTFHSTELSLSLRCLISPSRRSLPFF